MSSSEPAKQPEHQPLSSDVFLSRHGARIDKEDDDWLKKAGHDRHDDPHLSSGGEIGAKELAERIEEVQKDYPISHVVVSPFLRCVQTAAPVCKTLGLQMKVEPGICEVLTSFPPLFLDTEDLQKEISTNSTSAKLIDESYTPVMTRNDLTEEAGDCMASRRAGKAAKAVRENLKGRILFIGHGASCFGIAKVFGGNRKYIGYTSLTHFDGDAENCSVGKFPVRGTFGDVSHLSDKETSLNSAF